MAAASSTAFPAITGVGAPPSTAFPAITGVGTTSPPQIRLRVKASVARRASVGASLTIVDRPASSTPTRTRRARAARWYPDIDIILFWLGERHRRSDGASAPPADER